MVILLADEAGLRAGESRGLQWTDIRAGRLAVRRALDSRRSSGSRVRQWRGLIRSHSQIPATIAATNTSDARAPDTIDTTAGPGQ